MARGRLRAGGLSRRRRGRCAAAAAAALLGALAVLVAGCGREPAAESPRARLAREPRATSAGRDAQRHPEILNVRPVRTGARTYDFLVLISSPYDSPERYADGWRVLASGGRVLGVREIAHPHAGGKPFWRRQTGVRIPAAVRRVQIEGRDSRYGYGGTRLHVTLP